MSSEPTAADRPEGSSPSEIVSGYLAALSIVASLVALAWHTLRISPAAIILAIVAAVMSGKDRPLQRAAIMIAALCFFLGMTISVALSRTLW